MFREGCSKKTVLYNIFCSVMLNRSELTTSIFTHVSLFILSRAMSLKLLASVLFPFLYFLITVKLSMSYEEFNIVTNFFQETYYWYPQCYGLQGNISKLLKCCEIFSLSHLTENREQCAMECLEEGVDICCYDQCFVEKNGIFLNNSVNPTALLESITRGGNVGEEAVEVVKNSINKCRVGFNFNLTSLTCKIPEYVYIFTQCVLTENYINCPKLSESQECQELRKLIDPCDR